MPPHYKLVYFPIRANGEVIRQIFAYAGVHFEDYHVTKTEWKVLKKEMPFHRLPVLYVNEKPLAQSHAISRYLAREFGINGKNSWEEAQVNALADQFKDYQTEIRPYNMVKWGFTQGDADKLYQEVFLPSFRKNFQFFTNFLKVSGSGYLVGDALTWVDLLVAQGTATLEDKRVLDDFCFLEIKEHQKRIHEVPKIKKWLEARQNNVQ